MKHTNPTQPDEAARLYMEKIDRHVDRIKALSTTQHKKHSMINLILISLGILFALSVLYVIFSTGNLSRSAGNFASFFTQMLRR